MKRAFNILAFAAAAFLLPSCIEEVGENVITLSGIGDNIRFEATSPQAVEFSLASDGIWSISKDADMTWLDISLISGLAGEYNIRLEATDNDWIERGGKLAFRSGKTVRTIDVSQDFIPGIYPRVEIENDTYNFECYDTDAKRVTIVSTVPWTLSNSASWLSVSPESGDVGETVVTFTLQENTVKSDRDAALSFAGDEASYTLNIHQRKFTNSIRVFGLPESMSYSFSPTDKDTLSVKVISGEDWNISTPTWIKSSATSGPATSDTLTVTFSTTANGSKRQDGEIVFSSTEGESLILKVSQAPGVLARWPFSDSYIDKCKWATKPYKATADECNPTAYMQFFCKNSFGITTGAYKSKNGEGHYVIRRTLPGDYIEFHVPVTDLKKGTQVAIRMGLSGTGTVIRYYRIEYLEDGQWKMTSNGYFNGRATIDLATVGAKNCYCVDERMVLSSDIDSGELCFRMVLEGDGKTDTINGSEVVSSTSLRIRQWEHGKGETTGDGTLDALTITVVD